MRNIVILQTRCIWLAATGCFVLNSPAHAQFNSSQPDPLPLQFLQAVYANQGSTAPLRDENLLAFQTQVLEKPGIVLVEFTLPTCLACNSSGRLLKEFVSRHDGKIDYLKFDLNHNLGLSYKYDIPKVPTVLLFKDGKLVEKFALSTSDQKQHLTDVVEAQLAITGTAIVSKETKPTN